MRTLKITAMAATIAIGSSCIQLPVQAAELGKTLDEIKARAKSEGPVQIAVTWRKEQAKALADEIRKQTGVRINVTRVGGVSSRERILNEAIAGVSKLDLINVSGELRTQYVKAGVLHKLDWKKLLQNDDADAFDPGDHDAFP